MGYEQRVLTRKLTTVAAVRQWTAVVHSNLRRTPLVERFRTALEWGACLRADSDSPPQ